METNSEYIEIQHLESEETYAAWRFQLHIFLKAQGLFHHNQEKLDQIKQDQMIIMCTITKKHLPLIMTCENTRQINIHLQKKATMNKPLDQDDIAAMESQLRSCVEQDRRYWRVNDVKIDAIHTAKTYEEFADRVAAAHLHPMEKKDYKSKSARSWNMCASKEKDYDE